MCAPHHVVSLRDGRRVVIRPTRPDDTRAVAKFVEALSPNSRYLRFLAAIRELPAPLMQRIVSGPRDEYAAWAAQTLPPDPQRLVGLIELGRVSDETEREIAVAVAEDWRRDGLARALVRALAREAACHGWQRAYADIRRDNLAALRLAHALGAELQASPHGPTLARITARPLALLS